MSLSAAGAQQATVAARLLADRHPVAAYTSPLRRCRETARIIARVHGLTPIADRGLVEVDYGAWAGGRLSDLRRREAWRRLMTGAGRFRFPQGETLTEAQGRAVAAIERIADRHPDDEVIVVTHADVIRCLVCHYLGMPLDLIHRLVVAPAGLTIVELDPDGAVRVPAVNVRMPEGLEP